MLKTILKLLVEVLGKKIIKAGLEEKALQYQNYITVGKSIWNMVDENFRISENIEKKFESKAAEFDKLLLAKFPELSESDVVELRQAIAGEINSGKEAVISEVDALKQLQEENTQLKSENTDLKNKMYRIQSAVAVTAASTVTQ
jgi:hypothetical protein